MPARPRGWCRENAMRPPSSFRARRQCLGALPISVPHDAPVRSYRPSHGGYAGQVAGEHASAASQLSTGGRRRTDRAKSFQADDEGSIPFTRSIFKIKDLSEIMRELNAPENC